MSVVKGGECVSDWLVWVVCVTAWWGDSYEYPDRPGGEGARVTAPEHDPIRGRGRGLEAEGRGGARVRHRGP